MALQQSLVHLGVYSLYELNIIEIHVCILVVPFAHVLVFMYGIMIGFHASPLCPCGKSIYAWIISYSWQNVNRFMCYQT